METIEITDEILKELKLFNRNVAWLKQQHVKKQERVWVTVYEIAKRTGWNKEGMRRARANGLVKYKRDNIGGMRYDITSIPEIFLIKQ